MPWQCDYKKKHIQQKRDISTCYVWAEDCKQKQSKMKYLDMVVQIGPR